MSMYEVSTLAGTGAAGFKDGSTTDTTRATHAGAEPRGEGEQDGSPLFYCPSGVAVDRDGNVLVVDSLNHRLRCVAPSGRVSTLAGSGVKGWQDGPKQEARFDFTLGGGVAVNVDGGIFVADCCNDRVRKITQGGDVSTLAGESIRQNTGSGPANSATFKTPIGITFDIEGNLIVSDTDNHRIHRISPTGVVFTLAGSGVIGYVDGEEEYAQFRYPKGVDSDNEGNIYVSDFGNHSIRKISPSGVVSTFLGYEMHGNAERSAHVSCLHYPCGIAVDGDGNVVVADTRNHRIMQITPEGVTSTIAGSGKAGYEDGLGLNASFNHPEDVAINSDGNVVVSDKLNHSIRLVSTRLKPPMHLFRQH